MAEMESKGMKFDGMIAIFTNNMVQYRIKDTNTIDVMCTENGLCMQDQDKPVANILTDDLTLGAIYIYSSCV